MTTSLVGTSICKDTNCIDCLCRLSCSFTLLEKNLEVVAEILKAPIEELFPALAFHKFVIIEGRNENL